MIDLARKVKIVLPIKIITFFILDMQANTFQPNVQRLRYNFHNSKRNCKRYDDSYFELLLRFNFLSIVHLSNCLFE